jgi:anhydro-N-acetylmuramic acid kinase
MAERYVGLMSGTSLDGVDAVLAAFDDAGHGQLVAHHFLAYPDDVRAEALALSTSGPDEIERGAVLARRIALLYAEAFAALPGAASHSTRVRAIGAHGQTVRHRPERGFTVQLLDAALLAERTGVSVVADLRSRDLAAGGQGAPLVPAYHAACLAHARRHRVVANIGGIANLTDLGPGRPVCGFDTGPGNILLDLHAQAHLGRRYDADGAWAASGTVVPALLAAMLQEPYFAAAPPKSTGRELFNREWLDRFGPGAHAPADVQATLAALTARSLADAVALHCAGAEEVLVCGGGAHNGAVMRALATALAPARVASTASVGVNPDWVEAMAFAWLARETLAGRPGNLPDVTGAAGPRVLGAIYPP